MKSRGGEQRREEERRSLKRRGQKKEDPGARKGSIRDSQQPTSPIGFSILETSATALCGTTGTNGWHDSPAKRRNKHLPQFHIEQKKFQNARKVHPIFFFWG